MLIRLIVCWGVLLALSCSKENRIVDGGIYITSREFFLRPVTEISHEHVVVTGAQFVLSEDHLLSSVYGVIAVAEGSKIRVQERIDYSGTDSGEWILYVCNDLKSQKRFYLAIRPKVEGRGVPWRLESRGELRH